MILPQHTNREGRIAMTPLDHLLPLHAVGALIWDVRDRYVLAEVRAHSGDGLPHLLAAAPEMLNALKAIAPEHRGAAGDAAIARAEGKT